MSPSQQRPQSRRGGSQRGAPQRSGPQRTAPRSASRRKRERRREQALRGQTQHQRGRTRWLIGGGAAVLVVVVLLVVLLTRGGGKTGPQPTPQPSASATPAVPLLAAAGSPSGQSIDGISCQAHEQVGYHIHAHLAVYVDGTQLAVPQGVGIEPPRQEVQTNAGPYVEGGACLYWLHTHTDDGVIHVEAPSAKQLTLGDFFDIWGQPLGKTQVGPRTGTVIAYVDGTRFNGDVRTITLTAHELIQLDVGSDVQPVPFTFPAGE